MHYNIVIIYPRCFLKEVITYNISALLYQKYMTSF